MNAANYDDYEDSENGNQEQRRHEPQRSSQSNRPSHARGGSTGQRRSPSSTGFNGIHRRRNKRWAW